MATSTSITSIHSLVDDDDEVAAADDIILALFDGATKDKDVSNCNDRHVSISTSDDDAFDMIFHVMALMILGREACVSCCDEPSLKRVYVFPLS
eukprot:scaffold324_cov57-Cyclotella_meneghiniana.AAC.2